MSTPTIDNSNVEFPATEVLKSSASTGALTCFEVRYNTADGSVWLFDALERRVEGMSAIATGAAVLVQPDIYDDFLEDVKVGRILHQPSQDVLQVREQQGTSMSYIELAVSNTDVHLYTVSNDILTVAGIRGAIELPRAERMQLRSPQDQESRDAYTESAQQRNVLSYDMLEWLAFVHAVNEGGFARPRSGQVRQLHPAMTQAYPSQAAA